VRINQDDLGSRAVCEKLTREALLAGRDVIIDRCNFDREQRAHWVTIGKARHCPIGAIVFQTPVPVCVSRVLARTGHPTLAPNSAESAGVVKHIFSLFRAPTPDEGIDFCRIVDRNIDAVEVARSLGLL
jgi:predicted kinase